jgi:NAD(P)-dependent dehydrogenase (short-subunit alcohol dehydrogenase family)
MNLNIRSLFLFCQAVAKASMIPRNKHGRIINIASIAGLGGNPDMKFIAYNTSKGAVVNFTRALAANGARTSITVNALAPGFFPSKMTKGCSAHGRRQPGRACAAAPPGRRRRPEGRRAAVRQRCRQAHHRADPGGRRRRQRVHNQQILLDNRPSGEASAGNFRLVTTETRRRCRTARCWCATTT